MEHQPQLTIDSVNGNQPITPKMLRGSAGLTNEELDKLTAKQANTFDEDAMKARAKILEILCQIRRPFKDLEPQQHYIVSHGPQIKVPLLHFGVAMSVQDVWAFTVQFECAPRDRREDLIAFSSPSTTPEIIEVPFKDTLPGQREARDKLLQYVQQWIPTLKVKKCLNGEEKFWVFTVCSNLDMGKDVYTKVEVEKSGRYLAEKLGSGWDPMWYWDYELCGIDYASFENQFNITWPTGVEQTHDGWPRSYWILERMPEDAKRDAAALRSYHYMDVELNSASEAQRVEQ